MLQYEVESDADIAVEAGQYQRDGPQVFGKLELLPGTCAFADKAYWLFVEQMAMPGGFSVTMHWQIGKDSIECVCAQLGKQVAQVSRTDDQFHIAAANQRA